MSTAAESLDAQLSALFDAVHSDTMDYKKGAVLSAIAGKRLNIQKTELAYRIARKEKPELAFFATSEEKQ